jgi:hypothetical protein
MVDKLVVKACIDGVCKEMNESWSPANTSNNIKERLAAFETSLLKEHHCHQLKSQKNVTRLQTSHSKN